MRVLVTRPEPDASSFAARIRMAGHEALLLPFMAIQPLPEVDLPCGELQGLIATSRNALRAIANWRQLPRLRELPIHVVGEGTAEIARQLGFVQIDCGPGTGAELAAELAARLNSADGPLVHLSGEEVAFKLADWMARRGFQCQQTAVYRMAALESLPDRIAAAFRAGEIDAVTLMSPETARIYVRLVTSDMYSDASSPVNAGGPLLLCLSDAVVRALGPAVPGRDAGRVRVAARPRADELLALICPDAAQSG